MAETHDVQDVERQCVAHHTRWIWHSHCTGSRQRTGWTC